MPNYLPSPKNCLLKKKMFFPINRRNNQLICKSLEWNTLTMFAEASCRKLGKGTTPCFFSIFFVHTAYTFTSERQTTTNMLGTRLFRCNCGWLFCPFLFFCLPSYLMVKYTNWCLWVVRMQRSRNERQLGRRLNSWPIKLAHFQLTSISRVVPFSLSC